MDAASWPGTPMKPGRADKAADNGRMLDMYEASTAAPSLMQSPNGGPSDTPQQVDLDALGRCLASLGLSDKAVVEEQTRQMQLQRRLEWYFSAENLCHDQYLRSHMDRFGWVPLATVLELSGLRALGATTGGALAALECSTRLQASGDFRRLRARNPAVWSAFAPRDAEEPASSLSPASLPGLPMFVPEVEVADEDLTIAASIESPPRASKEGSGWPCVEWLTSDPSVDESCLGWLAEDESAAAAAASGPRGGQHRRSHHRSSRRAAKGEAAKAAKDKYEFFGWDSDRVGAEDSAWLRLADDAYATPASCILQW